MIASSTRCSNSGRNCASGPALAAQPRQPDRHAAACECSRPRSKPDSRPTLRRSLWRLSQQHSQRDPLHARITRVFVRDDRSGGARPSEGWFASDFVAERSGLETIVRACAASVLLQVHAPTEQCRAVYGTGEGILQFLSDRDGARGITPTGAGTPVVSWASRHSSRAVTRCIWCPRRARDRLSSQRSALCDAAE